MSKVWFSIVLSTATLFGLPGISAAQHGGMRGGMHGGMHGSGFRPGSVHHNMDRRFDFDRRFDGNRRFDFDRRLDGNRRFDFDRRLDGNRRFDFNRRFFDPRVSPAFRPGFFLPF